MNDKEILKDLLDIVLKILELLILLATYIASKSNNSGKRK